MIKLYNIIGIITIDKHKFGFKTEIKPIRLI